jgi:lipoate-protein ligase B
MQRRSVRVVDLGVTAYHEALRLQRDLQQQRREAGGHDVLLLTEHHPVITLGRNHPAPDLRAAPSDLARQGIEIVQTERGGDITFHGPGQLVAYGIIDLRGWDIGAVDYVSGLEQTVIAVLADFGLAGERMPGARGVWIDDRKVASVGVNVRGGVSMHGVALNVAADLSGFDLINPCGMPGVEMTSISRELGRPVTVGAAAKAFVTHFAHAFDCDMEMAGQSALAATIG